MRRLAQVGATRFDPVGRTDRNIQFLGRVAIQVSDEKTAAAIVVVEPALECAGDARTELLARLARQSLARRGGLPGEQDGRRRIGCARRGHTSGVFERAERRFITIERRGRKGRRERQ